MKRKEFIQLSTIFGLSLPFQTVLSSCRKEKEMCEQEITFSGKVLIIGAGVAGLSAGHLLAQKGIEFQIIEASPTYSGRLKTINSFADFPIQMGAEWLHVETNVFSNILNDQSVSLNVNTVNYNENDSYGLYENGSLIIETLGETDDEKFVDGSWLGFFEEFILPSVSEKIEYEQIVQSIDYSGDGVILTTQNETFEGDKVIVTVPLKILQNETIVFNPDLSLSKWNAIHQSTMWAGIKVFFEFSTNFYPTITDVTIPNSEDGEITIYDAAYGQTTSMNVLGFFAVGSAAQQFLTLSGNDLRDYILDKLDNIFSGQATINYVQHVAQNWLTEPFIQGAYLKDDENANRVTKLFEPVNEKVYFAGEAYTSGEDWGGVHTAAQAAKDVINSF